MVNLWSTDHNFYQNACVCHRDEICYLNVLSSSGLFIYQTKSGGFWTPQGSHNSLNLGHTHLSRLPCSDFNPMAGRLLLNGGQKLGLGWLLQLRWRRRHNLAQLPPVSPSHQVTCHLRGRQVASQSHMLGWDWQTEMVSTCLWFFLEFVNSPQTFNKV